VFWRVFRKPASARPDPSWWRSADEAADAPSVEAVDRLAARRVTTASPDELERQDEMLEGLRDLVALAGAALPVIVTQHRVIGADTCHLVAPAGLVDQTETPGKLFVTSHRVLFAGGRVVAWPWHRVREVRRHERELLVVAAGAEEILRVRCNTYGDALAARHFATRLMARRA
jgi:hypothetical protein